jgi:hypothetical protein
MLDCGLQLIELEDLVLQNVTLFKQVVWSGQLVEWDQVVRQQVGLESLERAGESQHP